MRYTESSEPSNDVVVSEDDWQESKSGEARISHNHNTITNKPGYVTGPGLLCFERGALKIERMKGGL